MAEWREASVGATSECCSGSPRVRSVGYWLGLCVVLAIGLDSSAYGQWWQVVVNSAIFMLFAFSCFKPRTKRDWRMFGSFSAFIVALFAEMYGFPLTTYLLSGWIARSLPEINMVGHGARHLGDPHTLSIHIASSLAILAGFVLLAASTRVVHQAQARRRLATAGPYARHRHPQHVALLVIMLGFLLRSPTLVTLVMFAISLVTLVRLAHQEEREAAEGFGELWHQYAARTPRWFPRLRRSAREAFSEAPLSRPLRAHVNQEGEQDVR